MAKGTVSSWDLINAIVAAPINMGTYRTLIYGPPGIGKTLTPTLAFRKAGYEVINLSLTEETPMTELRGHFVLKGNEFVWHDGPAARAWKLSKERKVALIINEVDKGSVDATSFLHAYLDDPAVAEIFLPSGERISPKEGNFRVLGTMNGQPEMLPEPIQSRFTTKIHVKEVHPDALKSLPEELRGVAKNMTENQSKDRQVSIREFHAFAALRDVMPPEQAAQAIFGASAKDFINAMKIKAGAL